MMNIKIFGYKPSIIEVLIGAVVLLIVLIYLYNKINSIIHDKKISNEQKNLKNQIDMNALSFDQQTYKNMTDKLLEAMSYTRWGTDEDAIYSVFKKCENSSDVLQLITVFGTREYKNYLGIGSTPKTLAQWLNAQLSLSEIEKINNILLDKQIQIQF